MIWNLRAFGDAAAIIDDRGNILSYDALEEESSKIAHAVEKRCLVFSLCRNEIGSIAGYVGFLNHNIVPLLLSSHIEPELLHNLISLYLPAFLWAPKDQRDQFGELPVVYEAYDYVLLKTKFERVYPMYNELGLLLTTSGSTGSPKLVRQSYTNILDNAQAIVKYLELNAGERPITTLPMNYTYGLSIINSHLLVGATILATEKGIMQKEFWNFLKKEGATSFGGVPYTYEMLDRLRFYRMELPTLRTMTQAGGKILLELHDKFADYAEKTGRKFVVMYGQCEATARMGYLPSEKAVEKSGSMGIAIPGGVFRLIDADGKEIKEPYVAGELVYEGKNVTLGYAQCGEDLAREDERHGVLDTGDIAQFDEDGFYYIVGRKKRFLKIYGNRVNLDEIDRMIKAEFDIEAASAGTDDHMFIFLTKQENAEDVRNYVINMTKLNPAAFKCVIIDEIPKNDAGKTLYKELEKYYVQ